MVYIEETVYSYSSVFCWAFISKVLLLSCFAHFTRWLKHISLSDITADSVTTTLYHIWTSSLPVFLPLLFPYWTREDNSSPSHSTLLFGCLEPLNHSFWSVPFCGIAASSNLWWFITNIMHCFKDWTDIWNVSTYQFLIWGEEKQPETNSRNRWFKEKVNYLKNHSFKRIMNKNNSIKQYVLFHGETH